MASSASLAAFAGDFAVLRYALASRMSTPLPLSASSRPSADSKSVLPASLVMRRTRRVPGLDGASAVSGSGGAARWAPASGPDAIAPASSVAAAAVTAVRARPVQCMPETPRGCADSRRRTRASYRVQLRGLLGVLLRAVLLRVLLHRALRL